MHLCKVNFRQDCARKVARKSGSPFDEAARMTTIEGDLVKLDETCGAFITMNPGYLGRSELPEGLKALFRPMTVMVPDLVLICENMLMAQGFVEAKCARGVLRRCGAFTSLIRLVSRRGGRVWSHFRF